jgi:NDP-sugar pyrophosphorylase family protein
MQAVILVGGLGTRLGSLLAGSNKPMLPVAGRPFLEYLLLYLRKNGIREIVLCVGYRGDLVHDQFGQGESLGLRLTYSTEEELRGTAGALKLAEPLLHGPEFLVLNGDSFFDIPVAALIASHREKGALASIALAQAADCSRYGAVRLAEDGKILSFTEKGQGGARSGLFNGGIYVFGRQVLDRIPPGTVVSLEKDVLPTLVGRGLHGVPFVGYFIDIGIPETYAQVQSDVARLRAAID